MKQYDKVKANIKYDNAKPVCICCVNNKLCDSKECEQEVLLRDRFYEWQEVMKNKDNG